MLDLSPADLLRGVLAALVGFTVHEAAHAWTALLLGDATAQEGGRVTLNPFKHIDIMGFGLLVLVGFGWGRPVLVDRSRLKHPVRDDILVSLAGPAANLLLAFFLVVAVKGLLTATFRVPRWSLLLLQSVIVTNVGLGLFNLLPVPPLDGHRPVVFALARVSEPAAALYLKYGPTALLALIVLQWVTKVDLLPVGAAVRAVTVAMFSLVGLR